MHVHHVLEILLILVIVISLLKMCPFGPWELRLNPKFSQYAPSCFCFLLPQHASDSLELKVAFSELSSGL